MNETKKIKIDEKYVTVNDKKHKCYAPNEVTTPQNTTVVEVLCENDRYVLAFVKYRGKGKVLAIRWNVCDKESDCEEEHKCLGYPNIFGRPTWFVLPESILGDIHNYMLKQELKK